MGKQTGFTVLITAALFTVLLFQGSLSHAQTPADVPAAADPSRFRQQLPPVTPPSQTLQAPAVQGREQYSSEIPPGAEDYRFILNGVVIEGANAWTPEQLSPEWSDMLGSEVSVADIYRLSDRITQKYQTEGYFLSRAVIPQQEIEGGIVKIAVIEGYIQDVVFNDTAYPQRMAASIIQRITQQRPINIRNLEFQLMALNEIPGCSASSVLLPLDGQAAVLNPGGVRLDLLFRCDDNRYVVNFDNYGSKYVGPWQYGVRTTMAHGGWLPGSFSAAFFLSPQIEELRYISLQERAQVTSSGLMLTSSLQKSWSEPGSDLRIIDLYSRLFSASVGLEYPLILSRAQRLHIDASVVYKNIESDIISTRFYDDRLRIISAGATYERSFASGTFASLAGHFSQGLDILGARETGSEDLSREGGHSDFSKFEANASVFQPLPHYFGLSLNVMGQYSAVALLSSEEFGYGGYALGRAYDNSEITGDSGIGALAELTWNRYASYQGQWMSPSLQPFVYIDAGKVWNDDQGGTTESGLSAGFGVRLGWGENANISGTLAQPLTRSIENPSYGNGHNPRFLFSASLSF